MDHALVTAPETISQHRFMFARNVSEVFQRSMMPATIRPTTAAIATATGDMLPIAAKILLPRLLKAFITPATIASQLEAVK